MAAETDTQHDVAIRVIDIISKHFSNHEDAKTTAIAIAAEIEAYAEMKVQQAKGGDNV